MQGIVHLFSIPACTKDKTDYFILCSLPSSLLDSKASQCSHSLRFRLSWGLFCSSFSIELLCSVLQRSHSMQYCSHHFRGNSTLHCSRHKRLSGENQDSTSFLPHYPTQPHTANVVSDSHRLCLWLRVQHSARKAFHDLGEMYSSIQHLCWHTRTSLWKGALFSPASVRP